MVYIFQLNFFCSIHCTFLIISNKTVYRVPGPQPSGSGNFSYFLFLRRRKGRVMFPLLFTTEVSSVPSEVSRAIPFCLIDQCFFQKHRLSELHAFLSILDTELKTKKANISYSLSESGSVCDRLQIQGLISNNANSGCSSESVSLWSKYSHAMPAGKQE